MKALECSPVSYGPLQLQLFGLHGDDNSYAGYLAEIVCVIPHFFLCSGEVDLISTIVIGILDPNMINRYQEPLI